MRLQSIRLKPNCSYLAVGRCGSNIYNKITLETNMEGRIKSFGGTYTLNSPEFADEFDFTEIQNVTTSESWAACSSLKNQLHI
jgi:hypothetical protein